MTRLPEDTGELHTFDTEKKLKNKLMLTRYTANMKRVLGAGLFMFILVASSACHRSGCPGDITVIELEQSQDC